MLKSFHDGDLTTDVHGHLLGFDVAFVHDLNGDLFTGLLMNTKLNSREKEWKQEGKCQTGEMLAEREGK